MQALMNKAVSISQILGGIVYPRHCFYCERFISLQPALRICSTCQSSLQLNAPPFCQRCGRTAPQDALCVSCEEWQTPPGTLDHTYFLFTYQGIARQLIYEFKINEAEYSKSIIRHYLEGFLNHIPNPWDHIDYIIPLPPHKKTRLQKNDMNTTLARILGALIQRPVRPILKRTRTIAKQTALSRFERLSNPKGSLAIARSVGLAGKRLVLVDDVITTGATSEEAAHVLKEAGAKQVNILALARGEI